METPIVRKGELLLAHAPTRLERDGVELYQFPIVAEKGGECEDELVIEWKLPYVDIAGIWNPLCGMNRSIDADYGQFRESMTARSAPVVCLFGEDGGNRCTVAVSETREPIGIRAGVREENGMLIIQVRAYTDVLKKAVAKPEDSYELRVRLDRRTLPFYQAIEEVTAWWEIAAPGQCRRRQQQRSQCIPLGMRITKTCLRRRSKRSVDLPQSWDFRL